MGDVGLRAVSASPVPTAALWWGLSPPYKQSTVYRARLRACLPSAPYLSTTALYFPQILPEHLAESASQG